MTTETTLFSPLQVGALRLASRIVMAPLTRNRAPGALPNALMATYYAQRANPATGAGLLISEATAICPEAQGYFDVPGIWSAEQVELWRPITQAVHAQGGLIAMQLWHVGRISHVSLQPGGIAPVAPSAIAAKTKTVLLKDGAPSLEPTSTPRALDVAELPGIVQTYRTAARNAIDAGFDAVEVHGANGYLLDQFLRSGSNHRTDAYGGSVPKRARLMLEVVTAVCDEVGAGRVGLRLSPVTPSNDAFDPDPQPLLTHVMERLAPLNLAFLHIIEGATGGARDLPDRPFDYPALKATYRRAGGQAAWMVNNSYDAEMAHTALAQGDDLVAFGRPFISNPDLGARVRANVPFAPSDRSTYYGGGEKGYTDYPAFTAP